MSPPALTAAGYTALNWTLLTVSTFVIGLRIFIRVRLRILCSEDYLMLVAWTLLLPAAAIFQNSLSKVFFDGILDPAELYANVHVIAPLLVLSTACGKASVGLLLLRLVGFTSRWQRRLIIVSLAILPVPAILQTISGIVPSCSSKAGAPLGPNGACVLESIWAAFVGSGDLYSIVLDVLYSILATVIVHKLKFSSGKRAYLIVLLSLGYITATLALCRDIGYFFYDAETSLLLAVIIVMVESNLVIVCGSLATLTPIFEAWRTGKPLVPKLSYPSLPYSSSSSDGPRRSARPQERGVAIDLP